MYLFDRLFYIRVKGRTVGLRVVGISGDFWCIGWYIMGFYILVSFMYVYKDIFLVCSFFFLLEIGFLEFSFEGVEVRDWMVRNFFFYV